MTEEELKKKGEQLDNANQAEKVAPNAATNEKPDPVEQSIIGLSNRVKELRDYAASPVRIDKSGQTNWMSEIERVRNMYSESPEQQAAKEKRERTNRRIAALSDGLVALSNVAGAMAGATPIKPSVTMSAAHRKAVEDAARRRRENAKLYETARNYYAGLQYKQDKDNAGKEANELKLRQNAGKQADTLDATVARLRQNKAKADRTYEETVRHNKEIERLRGQSNDISASKGGRGRSGGSGKTYRFLGKDYPNVTEYKRAVYNAAQKHGVPMTEDVNDSEVRVNVDKLAADVELKVEQEKKNGGSEKGNGSVLKNRGKGSALKNRN